MKILVVEQSKEQIEDLCSRIEEAGKRTLLKGVSVTGASLKEVGTFIPELIFLGQFAVKDLDDILKRLNGIFPRVPIALVLSSEAYVSESIDLRRSFPVRILAQGDIPQIAQMILELGHAQSKGRAIHKGRVLSVVHTRGGVGASSFSVSAADAISRNGKSVVLVDLSVNNPDITRWSSYGILQQTALKKFFMENQKQHVPVHELIKGSPSSNLNLSVVGQMESFVMSYKMHVDAPDSVVSSYEGIERLIGKLTEDFEFVVLDLGTTWGVSTLSALALSTHVFFVVEGTRQNMLRSFENLRRVSVESEDPSEFDYRKWAMVVNGVSSLHEARALYQECEDMSPLNASTSIWGMPLSSKGGEWCVSGYTLYAAGDKNYVSSIDEIVRGTFPDLSF